MQINSSNYGCYFDEYQRTYPSEFHGHAGYSETHVQLADEVSQGLLSEVCFQGVRIHYGRFHTLKTDTIRTREDFPSIEMTFQLQGQTAQQSSVSMDLGNQQHNLSYRPYADFRSQLGIGSHHYVGIQLTETFFGRFADETSPALTHILNSVSQQKAAILSNRNLTITPALQAQLIRMTTPDRLQPLKRLYLEATVLDLLRQQLEQADAHSAKSATVLKANDVEKIWAIKTLLDNKPLESYSLLQLSRYVGLNDYKLKKGFRDVLNTTVFGYLNDVRMQHAHQLLRDTNQSIGEIASTLDYSETHHFSAAFKRKFGYLPSQIRKALG